MMDVDLNWLSGNTLEGHLCLDANSTIGMLTTLRDAFHVERCVSTFEPNVADIQMKLFVTI